MRAAMMADPEWQVYLKKLSESELLVDQRTSLMVPTKFAPIWRARKGIAIHLC